tara:strand:+ start:4183 stop:4833 length:651 start_codon:yes stop_codon:yes gene_type:complete
MSRTVVVINPNSNQTVTDGLEKSLSYFNQFEGCFIECVTLEEGPFGIESQLDSDSVVIPLANIVKSRKDAAAFVIACYSDPGIDACRSIASQPVFGIQESGVLTALSRADLFGVIAISDVSVERHRRYLARMQVLNRLAGELALNISVDESANGTGTYQRLVEVGYQLIKMGAGVIILGCAGMSRHRLNLEAELGIPVIDPTQAAVSMAVGTILLK